MAYIVLSALGAVEGVPDLHTGGIGLPGFVRLKEPAFTLQRSVGRVQN